MDCSICRQPLSFDGAVCNHEGMVLLIHPDAIEGLPRPRAGLGPEATIRFGGMRVKPHPYLPRNAMLLVHEDEIHSRQQALV